LRVAGTRLSAASLRGYASRRGDRQRLTESRAPLRSSSRKRSSCETAYAAEMAHDRSHWEQLWVRTLREHADKVAGRPPNAYLLAEAAGLTAGRALDAGCGHGAETLWLAARGWQVALAPATGSAPSKSTLP
jgi:2-polyprenyl-3-methyl-5-hydroxy-6-metoxy-1,4-benzoquinol methylase